MSGSVKRLACFLQLMLSKEACCKGTTPLLAATKQKHLRKCFYQEVKPNSVFLCLESILKLSQVLCGCCCTNLASFEVWLIRKTSELEIGDQPEDQKKKKSSQPLLLPWPPFKMAILIPGSSEWDCVYDLSPPILYSFLGQGLKACITANKGTQNPVSVANLCDNWD